MIASGPIARWIRFIELNPNITAANFDNARGIKYRGNNCLPWSYDTRTLNNISDRRSRCFYWTNSGVSLLDEQTPEFALMNLRVALTGYLLKNPDDTFVTAKDVAGVLQAVEEYTGESQ